MNEELKQRAREYLRRNGSWHTTACSIITDLLGVAAAEAVDVRDDARVRELVAAVDGYVGTVPQFSGSEGQRLIRAMNALRPSAAVVGETREAKVAFCNSPNCGRLDLHTIAACRPPSNLPPSPSDSERIAALEAKLAQVELYDLRFDALVAKVTALESRLAEMERDWRATNVAPRLNNMHARLDKLESPPAPAPVKPKLEWSEPITQVSIRFAREHTRALGDGWRLPTRAELEQRGLNYLSYWHVEDDVTNGGVGVFIAVREVA